MIALALLLLAGAAAPVEVAVTVDDLPTHGPDFPGLDRLAVAKEILAAFEKHGLPPVYGFVNGGKLEQEPARADVLALWRARGNPIGNHGFAHLSLNDTSLEDWLADIEKNEPVLARYGPPAMWHFFRFPYLNEGDTPQKRAAARAWLARHGYATAQVTIDFDDWAWNAPYSRCLARHDEASAAALRKGYLDAAVGMLQGYREAARRLAGREIKHVLLLHIGALDADRMDALLTAYEQAGVRFIALPEALRDPIYAVDPGVAWKAGATLLDELAHARKLQFNAPWNAIDEERLDKLCR